MEGGAGHLFHICLLQLILCFDFFIKQEGQLCKNRRGPGLFADKLKCILQTESRSRLDVSVSCLSHSILNSVVLYISLLNL